MAIKERYEEKIKLFGSSVHFLVKIGSYVQ